MNEKEISLVLGTAGHIDHGKTTLVKALTGVSCDRLNEEKKRGITIELGFAPLKLHDGRVVSIVDVPGHEKFIRQMVAGASGIDAVMLVVAADEGVMPQTREHLAILNLLGVHDGVIVISKADLVDEELLELAIADVTDFVQGTFLEGKVVVPVSSVTNKNIPLLMEELAKLIDRVQPRTRRGPFFMPIDRAFPISGFGTVVTGTAYKGQVGPGMEVSILPADQDVRVRSVQVHSHTVDVAWAGQRVAMSLSGVSLDELIRGDVVCARDVYRETRCFDVELSLLTSFSEPLKHWQRVRLHVGTADVIARVSLFDKTSLLPGESAVAQLVMEEGVVATIDQRFVIRFYSPLVTIGGGRILFAYGKKPKGKGAKGAYKQCLEELRDAKGPKERMEILVRFHGSISRENILVDLQELPADVDEMARQLQKDNKIVLLASGVDCYMSQDTFAHYQHDIAAFLKAFHEERPHQAGAMIDDILTGPLKSIERKTARLLIDFMAQKNIFVIDSNMMRLPDFVPQDDSAFFKKLDEFKIFCGNLEFQLPLIDELQHGLSMGEKEFSLFLKDLRERGEAFVIGGKFVLAKDVEEKFITIVKEIKDDITIAAVRDITGSSRKFVLPLLEYLDARGYTRRVGEKRVLLLHKLEQKSQK
ncbi:selenocysteine-specific translation elongation factor [Aminobacterium colombiense]|uniref:Selenocysteine-specific elongation factor n=1 Tax=Aminobacterium colombiense (strain DSM 12261 / ALA-1) TaxID=572547 RepID=D5EFE7_AMICL|nr:selenocysteine-specific translation elongation factor [Aminobacterium colombiense]ADE57279.1 selenocysteine-specific translation elongation factor [Aminobacterium colombiense DSM 12261]